MRWVISAISSLNFHVVTLFPEVVDAYTRASILGRAQKQKLLKVRTYQLRDTAGNKWGKVDERPYGGGPGMVLRAEPVITAVQKISRTVLGKPKVIITAVGGTPLTNAYAKKLLKHKQVIIVCGRYEGIDARAKKVLQAEEVSVGPYILTGGESRVASHEIYTRPEVLKVKGKSYRVPKVLLSGHHANIDALRSKKRSLH
jgi:tRNA (guanine37-N1)-methyltransferase